MGTCFPAGRRGLLLVLAVVLPAWGQGIVINEIMYHPYSATLKAEDLRQEYIELFNAGQQPVNLTGWQFTHGVDFTFPNMILPAGAYVVVAADVGTFKAAHPGVNNCLGNWTGQLSDSGETIQLNDSSGVAVDQVTYADEGDWSVRELGAAAYGHRGWQWRGDHDGGGRSLELIDPRMPNEYGQNWTASADAGGTPGLVNSGASASIAPLIVGVQHAPVIPRPDESVTVVAGVIGDSTVGLTVRLYYRVDRSIYTTADVYPQEDKTAFAVVTMLDDGGHADGAAGDGWYGAEIPAQPDGTVVEFFVEATDGAARTRTWPAPSLVEGQAQQVTNALYRVDKTFNPSTYWTVGGQPLYYLIMTEMERGRLAYIGSHNNDAYSRACMNGTFISVDGGGIEARYRVDIRNRGKGSRYTPPNNYRVNFPSDHPWKNVTRININSKYTFLQRLACALLEAAGQATQNVTRVQVRVNGQNLAVSDPTKMYGSYAHVEVYDSDWVDAHVPDDSQGNLYRCLSSAKSDTLKYLGAGADLYNKADLYTKASNVGVNDWSDFVHLVYTLDKSSEATYVPEVEKTVNVDEWVRWFAIHTLLVNNETNLSGGYGDDYYLFNGVADRRFLLLSYDTGLENLWNGTNGTASIWLNGRLDSLPVIKRFLTHPEFAPRYYAQLKELAETVFSPEQFDPLIQRELGGWVPQARIDTMKAFMVARRAYVLSVIPQSLTITEAPASPSGYAYSTSNEIALSGKANAVTTRRVAVNGQPAAWTAWQAIWTASRVLLSPGINRVTIQAFDAADKEVERATIDVWYDTGATTAKAAGTLAADEVWTAVGGPYLVGGNIVIPAGVTLTIEAGTTVLFDASAGFTIQGQLDIRGTEHRHVRLTRLPGTTTKWAGLKFNGTLEDNRVSFADIEYANSAGVATNVQSSRVLLDHVTWSGTNSSILNLVHARALVRDSVFPSISGTEPLHGSGLSGEEYVIFERCTFGTATGYNDIIDFTGGRRPGPILEFYDCTFLGGGDDALDLDGTDAYIEGSLFTGFRHQEGSDSSANGIATGASGSYSSQVTAVRNRFVGCDHAALLKEGCYLIAENNTYVNSVMAALNFGEPERNPPRTPGKGAYIAASIFWNNAALFEDYFDASLPTYGPTDLVVDNCILPTPWHSLGQGNIDADPLFVDANDLHLQSMSPARGTGLWGLDMGAYVPSGAAVYGAPPAVTWRTQATLRVGGPGVTHYKYSLGDPNGPWSDEYAVEVPIELTGLTGGSSYTVYVLGRNWAGRWQEQPNASRTWKVDTSSRRLVINEVLVVNNSAYNHEGTYPDVVELYYDGAQAMDLSGMSLTDDPCEPAKFVFPTGTTMNPGDYRVLFADAATSSGLHLGFALGAHGDGLYLYDGKGSLIDSVQFGHQLPDLSIGRVGYDGAWVLTVPTFGTSNVAQPLANPTRVKINEWLAHTDVLFSDDFVELHNPQSLPVDIGGFYLTDVPAAPSAQHVLPPLSFVAGRGFIVFTPDEKHDFCPMGFKLSLNGEILALKTGDSKLVDQVIFGPQTPEVSEGRLPDGAENRGVLPLPTPGLSNGELDTTTTAATLDLVSQQADKRVLVPTAAISDDWRGGDAFDDSAWLSCTGAPGGVGFENSTGYAPLISLDLKTQMYGSGKNNTCYIRIPFTIDAGTLPTLTSLMLKVRYDDAFVAYLNGQEVARANFSGTPAWNSRAATSREADTTDSDDEIDIAQYLGNLKSGTNILAVQLMNNSATSSDLLLTVAMEAVSVVTVDQTYLYWSDLRLLEGLRITELMYHAQQGDAFDYVELQNVGSEALHLAGVRFTEGIDFTFPDMTLPPGQCTVVVADPAAFQSRYGTSVTPAGTYSSRLSDKGEEIVLTLPAPQSVSIMRFTYDDGWYPSTDGHGQSLAIREPGAAPIAWQDAAYWKASDPTPGQP